MKKLTKVQKFIKENNITVFNTVDKPHNTMIVVTVGKIKAGFCDCVDVNGVRKLGMFINKNYDCEVKDMELTMDTYKSQKEMIEKFKEVVGIEEPSSKFQKTNKKLVHIEKGVEFDIVKFNGREGVKTVEFFGVTSGYPIVMLEQINMEGFEIVEKHIEKSAVAPLESPVKITPESTAMNVTVESESARQLEKLIKLEGNKAFDVLDYGCGLGRNIKYLLKNTNCFVDGCDTEEQVQKINKDKEKMEYFKNQATTITTSDKLEGKYEFILNSHVLNVVMDDVKEFIVSDMYRLLAKNGKAVIQVRTESDVTKATSKEKYGEGWLIKKGKDTTYQEGITKEKMTRLLTNAGFKIINHRFTKTIHMVEVTK